MDKINNNDLQIKIGYTGKFQMAIRSYRKRSTIGGEQEFFAINKTELFKAFNDNNRKSYVIVFSTG